MIEVPFRKYQIGRWQVDCARMTISCEGKTEKLSAKVFEILKLFIVSKERIVSKDSAIETIWLGNEGVGKTGFINGVWQLRKAFTDLGAESDEVFGTIQKVGYQILVPITGIEETDENIESVNRYAKLTKYVLFTLVLSIAISISIGLFMSSQEQSGTIQQSTHVTNYEGVEKQPSISPDGNFMAFQWRPEGKTRQIYIKNLHDTEAPLRKLTSDKNVEVSPVWSPNGYEIAYQKVLNANQCTINIYNLISNENRTVDRGCKARSDINPISWSIDGKSILYNKVVNNSVAIFSQNLTSKEIKQVSFPAENYQDQSVSFIENDERIAIIRNHLETTELILISNFQQKNAQEESFLQYENRMLSLVWDKQSQRLLVTRARDGLYIVVSINLQNGEEQLIDEVPTPGSLAINAKTNELFITRHYSNEQVEEVSLDSGKVVRRIASSSRDLYGHHVSSDNSILFNSNRSGKWEIWQRKQYVSKQLTHNIGVISIPSVSANGEWFAVRVNAKGEEQANIYISKVDGSEKRLVDNISMPIQSPNWSLNETDLYVSGFKEGKWGIFKYNVSTNTIEQITHSGEVYALQGEDGNLYVTRFEQNGIWKYDLASKTFTQINDKLHEKDFGSYFWMQNDLYYLKRTPEHDLIIKVDDGVEDVVLQFERLSIRSFKGISAGADGKVIISRHGVNDADIYSIPL